MTGTASRRVLETPAMPDVVFVAVIIGFFALCVAYVRGLDRIVRAAEAAETTHEIEAS